MMSRMVVWLTPDKVESLLTVIFSFSHMVSSLFAIAHNIPALCSCEISILLSVSADKNFNS